MYPNFLRIKGDPVTPAPVLLCMLQVAEENVASAQIPGVSELEALGTLRSKNNMFEFQCGKHYLSMSNTICFLSQTVQRGFFGGANITDGNSPSDSPA